MIDIISIHIGKTAGTAFRHVLAQIYGEENAFWDYPPFVYQPPAPLPDFIRAIHGHFTSERYINYFSEAKWIVWLRHPILRLISEYFFAQMCNDSLNLLHIELAEKNLSLLEFAENPLARNLQAKQVMGKELIDFAFVGLQEFYSEDLVELQEQMGWKTIEISIENTNPCPNYYQELQAILSDSQIIKRLAALNQDDIELYQEAMSLRASRRQESLSLQYTLMGLKQSQPLVHHIQTELKQLKIWFQQSHQACDILETIEAHPDEVAEKLLGFSIDSPQPLVEIERNTLLIAGWAVGQKAKPVNLQVVFNEQILTEVPINHYRPDVAEVYPISGAAQSGFSATVTIAGMRPNFELQLQVLLEDQEKVTIGTIRALRSPQTEVNSCTASLMVS